MKISYYKELDGVRAIAALMVMVFHFFLYLKTSVPTLLVIKKLTGIGQTGVSLFFVLSGFLITRILLKTKNNEHYFKSFYIRRAIRIFPLYYFFLAIYFFLIPIIKNTSFIPFNEQFYFWVYLDNIPMTFKWN